MSWCPQSVLIMSTPVPACGVMYPMSSEVYVARDEDVERFQKMLRELASSAQRPRRPPYAISFGVGWLGAHRLDQRNAKLLGGAPPACVP